MSLEQELRIGASDYHRGLNNLLGYGGYHNSYENENLRQNLNYLLNGSSSNRSSYGQNIHGSEFGSNFALQSLLKGSPTGECGGYSAFSQPGFSFNSPSLSSPLTPSSTFSSNYSPFQESSSLFSNNDQLGLSGLSNFSQSSNLKQNFSPPVGSSSSPKETSILGLSDISARLEASLNLSNHNHCLLQQPSSVPSDTSTGSRSRNSTPLSWNPLSQLTATPLSSVSPSPVMISKVCETSGSREVADNRQQLLEDEKEIVKIAKVKNPKTPKKGPTTRSRNRSSKMTSPNVENNSSVRGIQALGDASDSSVSSWAGVVRTSNSRLPSLVTTPPPQTFNNAPQTNGALHACPPPNETSASSSSQSIIVANLGMDFHRGPKVDPRWPVSQQVFLGPIPMTISWDEIRNVFYTKVSRRELVHFYVQSKPVNEVVYGQVVFDKASLATRIVKEGPVKVRGVLVNVTLMRDKMRAEKKK